MSAPLRCARIVELYAVSLADGAKLYGHSGPARLLIKAHLADYMARRRAANERTSQ